MGALVSALGARAAWQMLRSERSADRPQGLASTAGVGRERFQRWSKQAQEIDLSQLWADHRSVGVGLAARASPTWPAEAFTALDEPPELLIWRGDLDALAGARVAVVGTRAATAQGLATARQMGAELAEAGVSVVSGLAAGIDAAAHEGALSARAAPPVGVVACGPDVVYPRSSRRIWELVAARGLLVTEQPLGVGPLRWRFLARNRLIGAFGDLTVVVQSHTRGGALVTARQAAAQGRQIMAMPGSLQDPASAGCVDLLADGAGVCRGTPDVLSVLSMTPGARRRSAENRAEPKETGARILEAMRWQPASVEWLARRTEMAPGQVTQALEGLQRQGWVAGRAGWFARVGRGTATPAQDG